MAQNYVNRRRQSTIVIENQDRILIPERKISRVSFTGSDAPSRKTSTVSYKSNVDEKGTINPSFTSDEQSQDQISLREVHVGHSPDIRRKSVTYIKKELEIDYHAVELGTLCNRYNSHVQLGLTDAQAHKNRELYGKNILTPPKKTPLWITFLHTLVGGFQLLLWTAAILSFIAYVAQMVQIGDAPPDNLYLGIALSVLVLVLGLFTFYQEFSSGKVMDSFSRLVPTMATVTRDHKILLIPASELVVGDVVHIKLGDSIPADIRILECQGLKVDNSSLTGESEPQPRSPLCTDDNPMETQNLAFFSTNALEGTGKGLVVAVGDGTFIGRIAGLTTGMNKIDTPMSREVAYFVKVISFVAIIFGISFFAISLTMGYQILDAAIFLVGIIVANVPEGLLVTFTVILALTAKRMAKKNCVVRQLHAVETLGSCSVICSDKTGTLTQNKMTMSHIWVNNQVLDVSLGENGTLPDLEDLAGFRDLSRAAALCSRATFLAGQEELSIPQRLVSGDASESAILRFVEMSLGKVEAFRDNYPKLFEIPFNSTNKYQLSIHKHDMTRCLVVMKGAPERVINLCSKIRIGDKVHKMEDWKEVCIQTVDNLGSLGERVIGFCEGELPESEYPVGYKFSAEDLTFLEGNLVLVGLGSMIDPPRPGVPNAVELCRKAGIKVVMVTGDLPSTARAIARKVGIITPENLTREEIAKSRNINKDDIDPATCNAAVISGTELQELTTQELDWVLANHSEIVFARVSPQQKLIIVEGFQRLGKIVAVTGDGVNDSPALRKADIGIAMGISGSDVSKQAADMILLDDNFSSIVTGVEEGRLIFENLKKCIRYLLCANTANLLPFLLYITLQIPLPLGTIQMLAITLGTDILPTISLSYEKPEGEIMIRQPRNPEKDKLVTQQLISYAYGVIGVIEAFAGFFTYVVIMEQNGFLVKDLIDIRKQWVSSFINDLSDSYGQEWTHQQRKELEWTCWTAYFCTIVLCQWSNLLISKVRKDPLHRKLFDNWIVLVAIVGETAIACCLTYTPGLNHSLSYMPIKFVWWLTAVPFMFAIIFCDEIRRLLLRLRPNWSWYQNEFFY